ncbi:cadherin-23 isoform X1 [Lingula anatina]|uniref:Cadherin-23 isoform X1 n=1 Tax=Lingula anatina TaxID=7574 RepID=A0A1S3I146_LINAN|nr:cadherin-23 isoform X1 [Lingula anatina]XP_013391552.1 cadherin-23 isoform X1 [Lingula anatina]XP_013391553.1 cadherin-23 isoform X1 [Lingula anatina]XP_013391554.1 cadherin-23 isoform X1 [Lingula anatina]XP_013391555.1 cadherin-23 isoform X1 [Lingula anatina]XP_013391556.1 cadherin-23 isoform X1 [Lingula anatina]XP_013391557.1 cadherin-23 isoform X1 [Lingula anatina]|eukprot:XP_013391551.1 cadherin-23 isoform X1 [Lingula anatina]
METRIHIFAFILASALVAVCGQFGVETNSPPQFTAPSILVIKEDRPVGSVVGTLRATDSDGNRLTFSVSASGSAFDLVEVSRTSGSVVANITLNSKLNYETRSQFDVGFTVSDGVNTLTRTVTVYVVNVNDNAPLFSTALYTRDIPEDTPINSSILYVNATDLDYGPPTYYFYDKSTDSISQNMSKFRIDQTTGEVTLIESLDYEEKPTYQLKVMARDQYGWNSTSTIVLNVEDTGDQPPVFEKPTYAATIPEDTPVGAEVLRVFAQDGDRGLVIKNKICYSFVNGRALTSSYEDFRIGKSNGSILIRRKLDRDKPDVIQKGGVFQLTVKAQEYDPNNDCSSINSTIDGTEATVYITVQDVNDETPTFGQSVYYATVEEQLKGIPITLNNTDIRVTDLDLGDNGTFELYVTKNGQNYSAFSVTPRRSVNEAIVIVRVENATAVDFEKTRSVTFQIVAKETQTAERRTSNATIELTVLDRNDNAPVFANPEHIAFILENSPNGTHVITITATDEDTASNFSDITYSLQGGSNSFAINSTSGMVYVSCGSPEECQNQLDFEKTSIYYMTVEATDGRGLKGTTQLEVVLNDTNDNTPSFTQKKYSGVVKENSTTFEREIQVQATDEDSGLNGKVYYNITGGDPLRNFTIDTTTGIISLASPLNYEAMPRNSNGWFHLNVTATDWGSPPLSAMVQVDIEVVDENDNDPVFVNKSYTAEIYENATTGDTVLQVNATDLDKPGDPNSIIIYRIESGGMDKFRIEPNSGKIKVEKGARFNRETLDVYNLTVLALDRGTPQRSASCSAIVHILDVNDELPRFPMPEARAEVSENASIGHIVYTYNASDPDQNSYLRYSLLESSNYQSWFGIHSNNGSVYVNNTLNRENQSDVSLTVRVEDQNAFHPRPQNDTATLVITLLDYNDNPPEFIESPPANFTKTISPTVQYMYTVQVNESATTGQQGSRVVTLKAKDADQGQRVNFSIVNNTDKFEVNPLTGDVTLKVPLDREQRPEERFQAIAVDIPSSNTGPPRTSTATVVVIVMDTNDNDPVWVDNMPTSASVPENATVNTPVLTVNATDLDDGDYGNVTYIIKSGDKDKFRIDLITGVITVAGRLDRENKSTFSLNIEARDNLDRTPSRKIQKQITVHITDINDESPKFSQKSYFFQVEEDKDMSYVIATITANDRDQAGTDNSRLSYTVVPDSGNGTELFAINNTTGAVHPKAVLRGKQGFFYMTIRATDHGSIPLTNSTEVKIQVTDINDHKPVFHFPRDPMVFSVNESFPVNGTITIINATDLDLGENGRVSYRLLNDTVFDVLSYQTFKIDSDTGVLQTRIALDREKVEEYFVRIEAYDHGPIGKVKTAQEEITIIIQDINDHEPTFDREKYPLPYITKYVEENKKGARVITNLNADDKDKLDTIYYLIVEGNTTLFEVKNSGNKANISLKANMSLDREQRDSYRLVVEASNYNFKELATGNQNARVVIVVQVQDVNDNPPTFNKHLFTAGITKEVEPPATILELKNEVVDRDIGNNSRVQFYMVPGSMNISSDLKQKIGSKNPFLVDLSGNVKSDMYFESDMSGYVDFFVYVNDSGGYNDKAKVSIYLIGSSQQIKIVLPGTPDEVRLKKRELEEYLSNITGAIVNVDKFVEHDPTGSSSSNLKIDRTDVYVHAIQRDTKQVLSSNALVDVLEANLDQLTAFYKRFSVYEVTKITPEEPPVEGLAEPLRMALLITALVLLLLLLILIGMFFTARRKYKRKLKAATAYAYNTNDNGLNHVDLVPGTNLHTFEGTNPLFGQQMENAWPDGEEADADSHSESTGSESDTNSLDDNVIEAKEINGYDNKALTIDLYDDFDTNISPAQVAKSDMFLQAALNEHDATKMDKNDLNHTSGQTPYQEGQMKFDPKAGTVVINGMQTTDI